MATPSNPFRDPEYLSAVSTGSSTVTTSFPATTPDNDLSTSRHDTNGVIEPSTSRNLNDVSTSSQDLEQLEEELPPAYTPAADVWHGESTIEVGPRRPFQQAPPPSAVPLPPNQYLSPIQTGWQNDQPPLVNRGGPGGYQVYRNASGSRRPPPPVHPSRDQNESFRPRSAPTTPRPMSGFARDFYQSDPNSFNTPSAGSSGEVISDNLGPLAGAAQPASPTQPRFAPPPGRPPPGRQTGMTSSSPSRGGVNADNDDGRPTNEPVPGRPLMRHGKVLVYPAGHECPKCGSTSPSTVWFSSLMEMNIVLPCSSSQATTRGTRTLTPRIRAPNAGRNTQSRSRALWHTLRGTLQRRVRRIRMRETHTSARSRDSHPRSSRMRGTGQLNHSETILVMALVLVLSDLRRHPT